MNFEAPLLSGRLITRYKRFLADIELDTGEIITAHCANPGSMLGLKEPGLKVWVSASNNPKRKLKYNWELCEVDDGKGPAMVGIHTGHPNKIVKEALLAGEIPELSGYETVRSEVKYGDQNSRIDFLLQDKARPDCYVEVKNVQLCRRAGLAEFPDARTSRGKKHLEELSAMKAKGARSVMLYLVQRTDAEKFTLASDIDPDYVAAFEQAIKSGVETFVYRCVITKEMICLEKSVPFVRNS